MEKKLAVKPKYSRGAKVRVRTRGPVVDPELKKYENMRGTVVSTKEVVAYAFQAGLLAEPENVPIILFAYSVELEQGFRVDDLFEFSLELVKTAD
jgi:hypothetical protein